MNELPISWQLIDIAAVTDVIGGGTPSTTISEYYTNDHEKGIAWITPADLSGYTDKYIAHGRRSITKKGYNASSARIMPKGTVLFSSRAPIGYTVIAANDISTNQGFKSFVPNEGVDSKYLYYYLKSIKYLAESVATGTTFKELSGKMAKTLPFPLAPLAEQKRIVEKLDEVLAQVDAIKTRLDNVPEILKRFRQSVLAAAVSGKLTEKWRFKNYQKNKWLKTTLGDLVKIERGSSPRPIKKYITNSEDGVNWIKIGDTKEGVKYISSTNEKITSEGALKSRKVMSGDFILSNSMSLGRAYILAIEGYIHDGWFVLRLPESIDKDYFYCLLSSDSLQNQFSNLAVGGVVKNIRSELVKQALVNIPPLNEQTEIAKIADQYFAFADTIEKQVAKAQAQVNNLTQSILKKAFSGKLVAQNPNDEPAEQLLAKIAKARKEAEAIEKAAKKIKK